MIGIRHEKYEAVINRFPFHLGIDIKRDKYNYSSAQNWHENLEIQLCTEGCGSVLLNGEKYDIDKDSIIFVNSNVIHYTFTESQLTYTCLIISTDWCRQMGVNYDLLQFSPVIKNDFVLKHIKKLISVYKAYENSLSVIEANKILSEILIELIKNHSVEKTSVSHKEKSFENVKAASGYIKQNFNKKISLSDIADALYCDKYALCRDFKKYTGQTVIESLNRYRCIRAADFIKEGATVTEAAFSCGFYNMSFFTKTFKKYMGMLPGAYKKR